MENWSNYTCTFTFEVFQGRLVPCPVRTHPNSIYGVFALKMCQPQSFFSESTYCSIQYAYRSMCYMRESLWFFPEWLLCLDQPSVGCVHLLPKMYKAQFSYYDNWRFSFRTHCVCDSKRNVDILVPFMNKRWMISLFNKSRRALVESYSVLWEWRNWMCVLN